MLRGLLCIPFYEADNNISRLSISEFNLAVLFLKIKALSLYLSLIHI